MATTPATKKTMKWLKDNGYKAWIVEKWNPWVKIRQDFAGICDIIAVGKGETICVQSCTTRVQERVDKMRASDNFHYLKQNGWKMLIVGWSKKKIKREGIAFRYTERTVYL